MQKITPCLWFNDNAEEAVDFYVSIFKGAERKSVARYGAAGAKASGQPAGSIMTILFELEGQEFLALNGGPHFKFSPAISLVVNCKTQKEIDSLWDKLSADKTAEQCGWLKDKFGVSWQIVPTIIRRMMQDKNSTKANRVMQAILQMKKLDIRAFRQAYRRP
jgi:predicted 3-demethylubiquinone-9 3-methyltransferase (glyoxalase superfamily)